MPMPPRALPEYRSLSPTMTDAMRRLRLHRRWIGVATLIACLAQLGLAHDLAGIDEERRLQATEVAAPVKEADGGAKPAAAQDRQAKRALDRELAYQTLFSMRGTELSYVARLVNSGVIPYSIFERNRKWDIGTTLKVCFYSAGDAAAKQRIAQIASIWSRYGAIYFDFGPPKTFHFCQANDGALIRISFNQKGYWSLIGTRALSSDRLNIPTMGLEDLGQGKRYPIDSEKFKAIVIHEFGHAIGLAHEHQHPATDCYAQFDIAVIERAYGWTKEQATANLARLQMSSVTTDGRFFKIGNGEDNEVYEYSNAADPDSVMHYDLRKEDFKQPAGDCYIAAIHSEPSRGDQAAVARAYPKDGEAVKFKKAQNALIDRLLKTDGHLSTLERAAIRSYKY